MTSKLTIQTAAFDDLPMVGSLAHAIWPVAYADILNPEHISNILVHIYSQANLQQEMQQGHCFWLVYDGNHAIAYASAYLEQQCIWLKKLYVLPEYKGQGVGTRLIATIVAHFSQANRIQLYVNQKNTSAQAFYRYNGFTKTDEQIVRMGDYTFTDDIYSKALAQ